MQKFVRAVVMSETFVKCIGKNLYVYVKSGFGILKTKIKSVNFNPRYGVLHDSAKAPATSSTWKTKYYSILTKMFCLNQNMPKTLFIQATVFPNLFNWNRINNLRNLSMNCLGVCVCLLFSWILTNFSLYWIFYSI